VTEQRSERLPRAQRREQILAAATTAFARAGFAATSLDDVAREAGISRMIVYRHFESKRDLYEQALARIGDLIKTATAGDEVSMQTLHAFIAAAAAEPDGFRLLYRHAAREPEFGAIVEQVRQGMADATYEQIAGRISNPAWAKWAAACIPVVLVETLMAWLDAGQPDPATIADRIQAVIRSVIEVADQVPDVEPASPSERHKAAPPHAG
jgi:AcrR family transcriptional regulator